ncbi:hypothetical protein F3J17_20170 [Burkholderia sp. Ax-1719]|nr:hypothetical protein [Burkholderia sp. Ax-1719]
MLRGETAILAGRTREASGPRCAALQKTQAKKTGAGWPRSNNDKRRMVTRRHDRTRTVKTDSAISREFENFFDSLKWPCGGFLMREGRPFLLHEKQNGTAFRPSRSALSLFIQRSAYC